MFHTKENLVALQLLCLFSEHVLKTAYTENPFLVIFIKKLNGLVMKPQLEVCYILCLYIKMYRFECDSVYSITADGVGRFSVVTVANTKLCCQDSVSSIL